MATNPASPSPRPYFDPSLGRNHSRRGSTRKSFTSWSSSQFESPRTLCPRDGDAFSFDAAHLPAWYLPREDLWVRLPATLQKALTAVQHGGAAVLTGFDRLEKHTQDLEGGRVTNKMEEDELMVQLDPLPLPSPEMRTASNGAISALSVITDFPGLGSPAFSSSAISSSQGTSASPVSPICLSPFDTHVADKHERSRERSFTFTTPLEPHDAYYRTELSHLRTEALPRLRHGSIKVDTEWYEAKCTGAFSADEINAFELWWMQKKLEVGHLNEKAKRLSIAIGLASTGMGWTAP